MSESCAKPRSKGRGQKNVWNERSTIVLLVLACCSLTLFTLVRHPTVCLSVLMKRDSNCFYHKGLFVQKFEHTKDFAHVGALSVN